MGGLFTASTKGVPSHWSSPAPVEYSSSLMSSRWVLLLIFLLRILQLWLKRYIFPSKYDSLKDFIIGFPGLAPSPQKRPILVIV